jgi:hypothetical protein
MIDDINDDIDALIEELNATGPPGARISSGSRALKLQPLLAEVVRRRGSDLLLVAGSVPAVRIDGAVVRLEGPVLDGTDIEELVVPVLPKHAARQYREAGSADASLRVTELGRFRANLHKERGRAAAAIRVLPARVPRLADLALPPEVAALSTISRGLVLIGGATGAGKTTTMAALIDEINRRDAKHVITVEDPIEYEHSYKGIKLSRLLEAAGVTLGPDLRGENLVKYVLVAASDGYEVIYSLPEVDPEFTAGGIYVVYEADGKPLPADTGPFRMVVPDDKKHARWIRQIVSIKVLFPKQ